MKRTQERRISATYDDQLITVYQAFNEQIACDAVNTQGFLSPSFKRDRMTWIKPSFCWTMYRSGWATKANQERILAIQVKRIGFDKLLENACLASYEEDVYSTYGNWQSALSKHSVRVQWDPERTLYLLPIPHQRAIQIGIAGPILMQYIQEWVATISDITDYVHHVKSRVAELEVDTASFLSTELHQRTYVVSASVEKQLGM